MISPNVALIVGPTGVGKTGISIKVAKMLKTEIVSCDSMQIYRHMDIGTAKVTADEAMGVVHHMIDVAEPEQNYSVCSFVKDASEAVNDIISRKMFPLIVGGTGLYADSLVGRISFESESGADEQYREYLRKMAEINGAAKLHSMLADVDPQSAEKIHPNNVKRVIRALEYYKATGKKISDHNMETSKNPPLFSAVKIGLTRSRESLYERINRRVDKMISDGLLAEVETLASRGCGAECTSMQALGYKEVLDCLNGNTDWNETVELIKRDSRRYAKRQLTWFKRDNDIHWINLDEMNDDDAAEKCADIIQTARRAGVEHE